MKTVFLRSGTSRGILSAAILSGIFAVTAQADQVELLNGDRYSGKIVALESNTVVLNSEMLGTLRIRREQISALSMGANPAPAPGRISTTTGPKAPPVPVVSAAAGPNPQINLNSSVSHQLAANPNLVNEVRSQVLAGAGPKATSKYDALTSGLASGSLDIADIRKEAASVAAQLRQLGGNADDETAAIFNEYLEILDGFVAEADAALAPAKPAPVAPSTANKAPQSPPAK